MYFYPRLTGESYSCGDSFTSVVKNNRHFNRSHRGEPFPPEYLGVVPEEDLALEAEGGCPGGEEFDGVESEADFHGDADAETAESFDQVMELEVEEDGGGDAGVVPSADLRLENIPFDEGEGNRGCDETQDQVELDIEFGKIG